MNALLIDHDDSFTFNLQHWLQGLAATVEIINHQEINTQDFSAYDLIVLSPGPKNPYDYPHIIHWLKQNYFLKSIFGVCLGMQLLTVASGGDVNPYTPPFHGKKSKLHIQFNQNNYLNELSNIEVARYHSLKCLNLLNFNVLAFSEEADRSQIPMWIEHKNKKWLGVQFHPESFLTEKSYLVQNALKTWMTI